MGSVKLSAGRRLVEVGAVLVVVLLLVGLMLPPGKVPRDRVQGAEVKQNLHNIQLAVERYAVDHDGAYPPYLIGGATKYAAHFDELGGAKAFDDPQPCPDIAQVADPLLREGYLDEYPRNPFVRTGPKPFDVHKAQLHDPYWPPGGDPLRNGSADAQRLGTRFGADCTRMGQVLGDPRYQLAGVPGAPTSADACAGVMYPYWDIWAGTKPKPFLPGEFFYRGAGPVIFPGPAAGGSAGQAGSQEVDSYVMGVYGSWRDKGRDVLDSFGNPTWAADGQFIPDAVIYTLESGLEQDSPTTGT